MFDFFKAVEETYEQDLHQAIMLSKIAYEAQTENGIKPDKEQDQSKKGNSKKSKKSTMSLEEFNNMSANSTQNSLDKPENSEDKSKGSIIFLKFSFSFSLKLLFIKLYHENLCKNFQSRRII